MNLYLLVHCIHVNCVMLWMIGMFSLPWLFVLHKKIVSDQVMRHQLEKWEHHLLRYLINPALILTVISGIYLIYKLGGWTVFQMRWFQLKLFFLVMMFLTHGLLARFRKAFLREQQSQNTATYTAASLLAMILMVIINCLALLKPF